MVCWFDFGMVNGALHQFRFLSNIRLNYILIIEKIFGNTTNFNRG